MRRRLSLALLSVSTVALGLLTPAPASAGAIAVTRFDDPVPGTCDPGDCSLREAIRAANAAPGPNTIALAAGTYQLAQPGTEEDGGTNGDLDITNELLTITGQGSSKTSIDGGGAGTNERILDVHSELTLVGATVRNSRDDTAAGIRSGPGSALTFDDVSVTGHINPTGTYAGMLVGGAVSVTDSNVSGNQALMGFTGIYQQNTTGPFTVRNSIVADNDGMTECCNGLTSRTSAPTTVDRTTVARNVSSGNCCNGLSIEGNGPFTVTSSTISGNGGAGCCNGLWAGSGTGAGVVEDTTVDGTFATDGECCSGLYIDSRDASIRNVTVSGNRAEGAYAGLTFDPGLSSFDMTANNVTVTANRADSDGSGGDVGAGLVVVGTSQASVSNSISHGNDAGPGNSGTDCYGLVLSGGHNIFGATGGCSYTAGPGDLIGANPKLGPLKDNGGPTLTHALGKGSPAINAGGPPGRVSGGTACEATDQRGAPRKNCDIGAYELVKCGGTVVNRVGTAGKDTLRGTNRKDGMIGLGGKDTLNGKGGKDALCGGGGKDKLKGGGGKDALIGQGGNDQCIGGPSSDRVRSCEREKSV